MSDPRISRTAGYVAGGLIALWLIATDCLCPLIAPHTGVNAHDLQGICWLGFFLGMTLGGILTHTKPRPQRWAWLSLLVLLFVVLWPLLDSRTYAQTCADVSRHPIGVLLCFIGSVPAGIAMMYALNWVKKRLRTQLPPSTTD